MKKDIFKVVCLIMMASIASSVLADERTLNLESIVLESFDGDSNYTWKTMGSKFATTVDGETYPKLLLVPAWPSAVFGANREGKDLKSLGIWGRFDRQGYNWIDIYPTAADGEDDAGPAEIPIPGRVQYLDMWVWGSNLRCTLEAYVRDYQGVVHIIPLGNLTFEGWKNLRATVPANIPQFKRVLPHIATLTFVKFRVWTQPVEQVGNFYIYLDQFKIVTDTFESKHDGDELADPAHVQELWSSGTAAAGSN
ncbi:MAG: flagellar filament outer layer protein FlaA [Treponema sp.]|jgi:hypothetical protein|nr:flagellar filament outer layer protein FlaA [Treponema sp.]